METDMFERTPQPRRQSGLSLVELMVAITIGLLLLAGVTTVFVNSSQSNRELQKAAQQIENGRYAIDLLDSDLHHAGFFGQFYTLPAAGTAPDPCETGDLTAFYNAMAYPVQGYRAASFTARADVTGTTCYTGGLLANSNLRAGSDVVVVRRADTNVLSGTAVSNEVYLQANTAGAEIQLGNGSGMDYAGKKKANGGTSTILIKDGSQSAPVRKFRVHVYFVAPCSAGSGSNGVCASSDDSIPTLKRLELTSVGGSTKMRIVPLVEGIEYIKLEYGVDNSPSTVNLATGLNGDATVDSYTATPSDWSTVIAAKIYVLARNTDLTVGYADDKTYTLGSMSFAPTGSDLQYKRHVYTGTVHMMNLGGRREIP